jgi:colanic acid biosynthesis glycosyl transferase WcaI
MRVLIHSLNAAPEPVGIGKYSGELAAYLAARGHQVDVLCSPPYYPGWQVAPAYRGLRWTSERRDGARYLRAPVWIPARDGIGARTRVALESSFTLTSLRWWLPILFAGARYDVVYSVCPPLQAALLPLLYGALRRVPWVLHVQDFQVDAAFRLGILPDNAAGRALYRLEGWLLRRATQVTTITGSMARRAVDKGVDPARLDVTPNWSDLAAVRPAPRENPLRDRFGAGPHQTLFLYAGNIGEKQGLELLLEVAERLEARHDLVFGVVGDGASRRALEAEASRRALRNLRFFDLVPPADLPAMLAAADVHLVIQRAEAADLVMPSKLTNVMAAGRPAIATAAAGTELHDVLTTAGAGLVVPPGDADALQDAVTRLADDPAARAAHGAAARRVAERELDRDVVLGRLEALLEGLARREHVRSSAS